MTETVSAPENIRPEELGKFKEIVDISTVRNRNLLIVFVVFACYVLAATFGTTDEMLLLPDSTIDLPLINIGLPVVNFYVFAPVLFLLLHLNLLFNFGEHDKKLQAWQKLEKPDKDLTLHITPSLFDFTQLPHRNKTLKILLQIFTYSSLLIAPVIILSLITWRFADYHHVWITWLHFALVI